MRENVQLVGRPPEFPNVRRLRLPELGRPAIPLDLVGRFVVDAEVSRNRLRVTVQQVPDGLLALGTCQACGARLEHVAALPGLEAAAIGEGIQGHLMARAIRLAGELRSSWASGHRCLEHAVPTDLLEVREQLVGAAVQAADARLPRPPRIHLVTPDAGTLAIDIEPLPPASTLERARAHALRSHRLRSYLGSNSIDPIGLVLVAEATGTPQASASGRRPRTRDLVFSVVATQHFARAGRAWLEPCSTGSRRVGRWTWAPLGGPCLPVDGILASSRLWHAALSCS